MLSLFRRPAGFAVFTFLSTVATLAQPNYTAPYYFSTLAGIPGGPGDADGPGPDARFDKPRSVAVDSNGNLFVADANNHTIRKISPTGTVTTLAGAAGISGSTDGTGPAARFSSPAGVAVDGLGNILVADTANQIIRKITPAGVVTTLAGAAGIAGHADGLGSAARFGYPVGVAVDSAGNIYVTDNDTSTIRKITSNGLVSTLAGDAFDFSGHVDGLGSAARFSRPRGVAVDGAGNVYVADTVNQVIRKISPAGAVVTLDTGALTTLNSPTGLAVDTAGNVYVTSSTTILKISPGGLVTVLAGGGDYGGTDGTGSAARFNYPEGLAVDNSGNVYVADTRNQAIRKITSAGTVTTLAGSVPDYGNLIDAIGAAARFNRPTSVAVDGNGNVFVADTLNDTIRRITPAGMVTTVAGSPTAFGSADGTGSDARFNEPSGVAADSTGNVYVADTGNFTIRKISPTGLVTTLAGSPGLGGSLDGMGSAARFALPSDLAVDANGNIYVADTGSSTIRRIAPNGAVSTLAGSPGHPGSDDGIGSAARFNRPQGVAVDGTGNVYVADTTNEIIRKVTPGGQVTTLAGAPGLAGHDDGAGSAARFDYPADVAVDGSGNVFVADADGSTIRRITPAGVVSTVAGSPGRDGNQNGVGSGVRFNFPSGLAVDQTGILYVANTASHNIDTGRLAASPAIITQPQNQTVTPGASVMFSVMASGAPDPVYQWYFNGGPFQGATSSTLSFSAARSSDAGNYSVTVTNALGSVTSASATLSVSSSSSSGGGGSSGGSSGGGSSGGGGGGGAPSPAFLVALLVLAGVRRLTGSRRPAAS